MNFKFFVNTPSHILHQSELRDPTVSIEPLRNLQSAIIPSPQAKLEQLWTAKRQAHAAVLAQLGRSQNISKTCKLFWRVTCLCVYKCILSTYRLLQRSQKADIQR